MQNSLSSFRALGGSIVLSSRAYIPGCFCGDGVRTFASRPHYAMPASERSKWEPQALALSSGPDILERIRQFTKKRNSDHGDGRTSHPNQKSGNKPSTSPTSLSQRTSSVPQTIIAHKATMKKSFPDGWNPPKKLSREAMEGLRTLHDHDPETFTTAGLANRFKISPEAVRRILKSRWKPDTKRLAQMAQKEARARRAMIVRQKFGVESVETDEDIPAMYLDEESDKLLSTNEHHPDIADPTNSDSLETFTPTGRAYYARSHTSSSIRTREY
jgi:hypothetical protein